MEKYLVSSYSKEGHVLKVLKTAPDHTHTQKLINEELGYPTGTISSALSKLRDKGLVEHVSENGQRGRWLLTEAGKEYRFLPEAGATRSAPVRRRTVPRVVESPTGKATLKLKGTAEIEIDEKEIIITFER